MTREEKEQIIGELTQKFADTENFYITDASGFTVEQINNFRRMCFKSGVEYKVYKNTLIQKALERQEGGVDYSPIFNVLTGFSGVMFSKEVGNAPAKIIREFRKKLEGKPVLKAASLKSEFYIGDENVNTLADLKSKNELIGEIVGLLQSPARNVISALLNGKKNAEAAEQPSN
jgi:large subunit ribosomal protein L10